MYILSYISRVRRDTDLLVGILLVSCVIMCGFYRRVAFEKVRNAFYSGELKRFQNRLNRYIFFDRILFGKADLYQYNTIHCYNALVAFMDGNNERFKSELDFIKNPEPFEMKIFLLALHYYIKKDFGKAQDFNEEYQKCQYQDTSFKIIMEYLFNEGNESHLDVLYDDIVYSLKNPAILKMIEEACKIKRSL